MQPSWIKKSNNVKASMGFLSNSNRSNECKYKNTPGPGSYENPLELKAQSLQILGKLLIKTMKSHESASVRVMKVISPEKADKMIECNAAATLHNFHSLTRVRSISRYECKEEVLKSEFNISLAGKTFFPE